jgi:hypothetical protein
MSVSPKGKTLPKKGKDLHLSAHRQRRPSSYAPAIAKALGAELKGRGTSIKTVMKWTGASERTVKGWLSGTSGPSGDHLVDLLRRSDRVFQQVLLLADREPVVERRQLSTLKTGIAHALGAIEAALPSAE